MDALPLDQVYPLLQPGPVVLLTTCRDGHPNVTSLGGHMMVDALPPYIACVVPAGDASYAALRSTRDCVIAVPAAGLVDKVAALARCPAGVADRFAAAGLTPAPAETVASPLIRDCFVNLECRVTDTRLVSQYKLFILEVVRAWHDPAQGWPPTLAPRALQAAG